MPAEDAYSANEENPFIDRDFEQGRVALWQTQRRHAGMVVGFRLTQCAPTASFLSGTWLA